MNPEDHIEPDQLVHRQVYRVASRNLLVGVWDSERQGFVGIREKFNDKYLAVEYEYDLQHGTARGVEVLDLAVPGSVSLKLSLGTVDSITGRPVEFVKDSDSSGPLVHGTWHYVDDDTVGEKPSPQSVPNEELYALLETLDTPLRAEQKRLYDEEAKKFGWNF